MSDDEDKLIIGKRCYVGNLAWRTSWQDLKDKFRECGQVVYANVMRTEDGWAARRHAATWCTAVMLRTFKGLGNR